MSIVDRVRIACLVASCVATGGCTTYRLVDVDLRTDFSEDTRPEVTTASGAGDRLARCRNVVISLPMAPTAKSTVSGTQGIDRSQVLVQDRFGVWVREMERMFVDKGYRVLSREKYEELMREARNSSEAAKQAAGLIGADLIVQINSLEYNPKVSIKQSTQVDYLFRASDGSGAKGQPVSILRADAESLSSQVSALVDAAFEPFAYMAFLDLQLIDAKTGEILLFYRNKDYRLRTGREPRIAKSYLFRLEDEKWQQTPIEAAVRSPDKAEERVQSLKVTHSRGGYRDMEPIVRLELVRAICQRFIDSLPPLAAR